MKHTIKKTMFVHAEKDYSAERSFKLNLMACDMSKYGYIKIGEVEVSVDYDLPENFNFTQAEIDALRKEQKRIQAEAQNKITQIEEHIQSLLCLEHKVGA